MLLNKHTTQHQTKSFCRLLQRYYSTQKKRHLDHSYWSHLSFSELYQKSIDYETGGAMEYWDYLGNQIHWFKKYDQVLDSSRAPFYKWYTNGLTNTTFNAVDIHAYDSQRRNQVAVYYDSPLTESKLAITYAQLKERVDQFAALLHEQGVKKGDTVVIYMPMIPEAMVAMLAVGKLGAIHSVVFGGFASHELAVRIEDAGAKFVVSASCGIESKTRIINYKELLDKAIDILKSEHKPQKCIIYQRKNLLPSISLTKGRDLDWEEAVSKIKKPFTECVPVESNDLSYILYTSGTTGKPKGVARFVMLYFAIWLIYEFV